MPEIQIEHVRLKFQVKTGRIIFWCKQTPEKSAFIFRDDGQHYFYYPAAPGENFTGVIQPLLEKYFLSIISHSNPSTLMTTIDSNKSICTLINVFTVSPEKHLELFNLLKEATEKVMSKMPGYISANLHVSDDKKTVTNYAQWATLQDFQNMLKNEEAQQHMMQAGALAVEFRPVTYNNIWTHQRPT